MTWWALLFSRSMLARYERAGWTAALLLDNSGLAAPLERLLDVALDRVPELVLGGLLDPLPPRAAAIYRARYGAR